MQAEIPLSAVCEGLGIDPDKLRKWGNRGIVSMERGRPNNERRFTGDFALQLAAFNEMAKVSMPLSEAWKLSGEVLKIMEANDADADTPMYLICVRREGWQSKFFAKSNTNDLVDIVRQATEKGWHQIITVEVGHAIARAARLVIAHAKTPGNA